MVRAVPSSWTFPTTNVDYAFATHFHIAPPPNDSFLREVLPARPSPCGSAQVRSQTNNDDRFVRPFALCDVADDYRILHSSESGEAARFVTAHRCATGRSWILGSPSSSSPACHHSSTSDHDDETAPARSCRTATEQISRPATSSERLAVALHSCPCQAWPRLRLLVLRPSNTTLSLHGPAQSGFCLPQPSSPASASAHSRYPSKLAHF